MNYSAPWWLPGGHLQTIYPALRFLKPVPAYRRERWDTPDGDFIDVDFIDGEAGKPFIVMFHGLEGSSRSHYALAMMVHVQALGWSGAVPHFRGCSGEMNRAPRFYHSGDSAEVDWILHRMATTPRALASSKRYAAGVSLGGNALLRWLGEPKWQTGFVDAACAISAPLNLTGSGTSLARGLNRIYTMSFLRTMKAKALKKLEQYPGLFDRDLMLRAKTLHDFDNLITAPLHGYRDAEDYWHRASAYHVLDDIRVPTLVLNARNDPFLPERYLPLGTTGKATLEHPSHGGHGGFALGPFPGKPGWLPRRIVDFLESASAPEAVALSA